jgi:hypothetical protein
VLRRVRVLILFLDVGGVKEVLRYLFIELVRFLLSYTLLLASASALFVVRLPIVRVGL